MQNAHTLATPIQKCSLIRKQASHGSESGRTEVGAGAPHPLPAKRPKNLCIPWQLLIPKINPFESYSLYRNIPRNSLVARKCGRMWLAKGRKILFVLNVVASGEKYSIVPCFYYFQSFTYCTIIQTHPGHTGTSRRRSLDTVYGYERVQLYNEQSLVQSLHGITLLNFWNSTILVNTDSLEIIT